MAKTAKKAPAKKAAAKKTVTKKAPKSAPTNKAAAKKTVTKKADPVSRHSRLGDEAVIRVLTNENPRRPGTKAHSHFEKMRGGVSVGDYLRKFKTEDRRRARQWLTNTVKDGHISVLGG